MLERHSRFSPAMPEPRLAQCAGRAIKIRQSMGCSCECKVWREIGFQKREDCIIILLIASILSSKKKFVYNHKPRR